MQLNILGFKIGVEMLILIGVIYLIFIYHAVRPCVNMPLLYEGLTSMTPGAKAGASSIAAKSDKAKVPTTTGMGGGGKKEGFSSGYGAYNLDNAEPYKLADYSMPDTSKWFQPNLTVQPGQPLSAGVKQILDRPEQPVPLPEGEMLMFANTEFTPEACPSTYSNSMGCANMTVKQFNYLQTRGGNNVPYSEY